MNQIEISVLRVEQPIGEFYIGAIDARSLNKIAYTEIRRFNKGTQDQIAGIQRERAPKRVKELSEYVNFDYATFPTSVILAIDERTVKIDEIDGCPNLYNMIISEYESDEEKIPLESTAFIIDGQHRLAGLESLERETFEVNVSIFVGADMADKAEIFSRVNLAQTKVNRSLVYDLFAYAEKRSPYKTAHEVTLALNGDEQGPFFQKIKRLGKATPGLGKIETLAQATVADGIIDYITSEPEKERNTGFLGLPGPSRKDEDWKRYIFQNFYDTDDAVSIFKILTNYFGAVSSKWTDAWYEPEIGMILNRTTGYNALMRFLREAYTHTVSSPRVVSQKEFAELFEPMKIKSTEFNSENFKPGGSGASTLFKRLMDESSLYS